MRHSFRYIGTGCENENHEVLSVANLNATTEGAHVLRCPSDSYRNKLSMTNYE